MAVWLVAEDRVQIIRAENVATYAVAPLKNTRSASEDPVARLAGEKVRVIAGTTAGRDQETLAWTALLTFENDGRGQAAVKILSELANALRQAAVQVRNSSAPVYIHGPLPRLDDDPLSTDVWQISAQLPVKNWPTTGSYWRDPLA